MSRGVLALRIAISGLIAGGVINLCEWGAHRWLLDAEWRAAFHALGKEPRGWTAFIPANFWLGILAVWAYRWSSQRYGSGPRSALRVSLVCWLVFWVIPMLSMEPMQIFPDRLLGLTILIGLVDAPAGTFFGAWVFDRVSPLRPSS